MACSHKNEGNIYSEYYLISVIYPGWPPSELKGLTVRERGHWLKMAHHLAGLRSR